MNLTPLVRNWWMMAIRGVLAMAFGVSLVIWPGLTLSIVVLLFGIYATIDGAWSIAAGMRASTRLGDVWPVLLEGAVSISLGVVALAWPFVPRSFIYMIAAWGVITGVLELAGAIRLPSRNAGYWLLGTAGVSSLFLALLLMILPHADDGFIVRVMATYAEVFGIVILFAAILFARDVPKAPRPADRYASLSR
jgi:uncharacterized membrane protein HdeD (DUF308 family)